MIRIDRGQCPSSLDGPGSAGGKELERAERHFGDPATREEKFPFGAYGKDDVREALRQMFGMKCAYCESVYGPTAPMTVEHYRPKGAYDLPDGTRQKPGYWWLASTWSNLLPSCTDCNSERGHDAEGTPVKMGKANRFPLVDESRRANGPGGERDEEPLLLDPTFDEPDEHLEFIDRGLVRPAEGSGGESNHGKETIEVLGLRRGDLVKARRNHLELVDAAIKRFRGAHNQLDQDPKNQFALEIQAEAIGELQKLMDASTPYAGMARQRIRKKLAAEGFEIP
jgi:uncharacterized protein (TIGR02646 family)